MLYFKYQAKDIAGKPRRGQLRSESEKSALKELKNRSFTDVTLVQTEAPKPPMSTKVKTALALAGAAFTFSVLYVLNSVVFGPPDMELRFQRQDQAIESKDIEARFEDFADEYVRVDVRGKKSRERKSRAVRKLTADKEGHKGIKKFRRRSKVLWEGWRGEVYVSRVEHESYQGTSGSLGVVKFKQKIDYRWRRQFLRWRITSLKIRTSKRL